MSDKLDENFAWFVANRDELLKTHKGASVVIVDCAVVAEFSDDFSAAEHAYTEYGTGNFIVQSVSENPSSYIATVSSIEVTE